MFRKSKNTIKISLQKAADLKRIIEGQILQINGVLTVNNSLRKGSTNPYNLKEEEARKDELSNLLCTLYELLQNGNSQKARGESHNNAYYIKQLSEITKEKLLMQKLPTETHQCVVYLNDKEVNSRISNLLRKEAAVKDKIIKFNSSQTIELEYIASLKDVYESVHITIPE